MRDALPPHFPLGEGKSHQLGRITLTFKASAADSGGAYTLCEAVEALGTLGRAAGVGHERSIQHDPRVKFLRLRRRR